MANLLSYDGSQLLAFLMVVIRISGIIATAPIFGSARVPARIKLILIILLSLIIQPFVPPMRLFPEAVHHYAMLVFKELLIGFALGFVGKILFAAVDFAGELISYQMGLSMAGVVDPQTQQQISLITQVENMIATIIFLVMNAHHAVIEAIVYSYTVIPLDRAALQGPLVQEFIRLSAGIFSIGLQLGAPLIVALFLANVIMGLIARAVPQIQIFVVGFPITIMLGFILMWLGVPFFVQAVGMLFETFDDSLMKVIQLLQ